MENTIINNTRINFCVLTTVNQLLPPTIYLYTGIWCIYMDMYVYMCLYMYISIYPHVIEDTKRTARNMRMIS